MSAGSSIRCSSVARLRLVRGGDEKRGLGRVVRRCDVAAQHGPARVVGVVEAGDHRRPADGLIDRLVCLRGVPHDADRDVVRSRGVERRDVADAEHHDEEQRHPQLQQHQLQ
ncbi:hypothetical protein [Microbacterium sp.]|uniref:hypothetical protein n=1 Tax=Microbacterium sp. TaxID=51671 RepID=UPI002811A20C|nr:hypothetical protein [Microbacterium sp.]